MLTKFIKQHRRGNTIIEIIIAVAIFALIAPAIIAMLLGSNETASRGSTKIQAAAYSQQALEAVSAIRNYDWDNLTAGTYGLSNGSGYWEFSGASETIGNYTRTVTITDLSAVKKQVDVTITWEIAPGVNDTLTATKYLTNWESQNWTISSSADFTAGSLNGTTVQTAGDGELALVDEGDYSSGSIFTSIDLGILNLADVYDMFLENDVLYVATSYDGTRDELIAYDVSDLSSGTMTELDGADINTTSYAVTVADGYAYVATGSDSQEIVIVRLSDYTVVNQINVPGSEDAFAIAVSSDKVYVGTEDSGDEEVYVYDVSSPEASIDGTDDIVASFEIGDDVNDAVADNGYIYFATDDNSAEVYVVKVSTDTKIQDEDLPGNQNAEVITIEGDIAYVGQDNDIEILDISNVETNIVNLGNADISDNALDIAIGKEYGFVATDAGGSEEIQSFDLSTYNSVANIDLSGSTNARAIKRVGANLVVGSDDNTNTIQVVRAAQAGWSSPQLRDFVDTDEGLDAWAVHAEGDYAYLGTSNNSGGGDHEFYIIETTDPDNLVERGSYDIGADVNEIFVSGNYAYIANDNNSQELIILDISNKLNPTLAGSYDSDEGRDGYAVYYENNIAYLGTGNNGGGGDMEFYVLDVSNPASVSNLDELEVGSHVNDIVVSGDYAYIANDNNSNEIIVADVSNTSNVTEEDTYSTSGDINGLDFSGNLLFAVGDGGDFFVFDISDIPGSGIVLLGSVDLGDNNYTVSYNSAEQLAFVGTSTGSQGIKIIDVSTPASPVMVGSIDIDNGYDSHFVNDLLHVATRADSSEYELYGPTASGSNYPISGTWTSEIFDSSSTSTSYNNISWTESGTGDVKFRLRTASSSGGITNATWVGNAGDSTAYYETSGGSITLDPGASGSRYIQLKAILESSGANTPVLEDVTIEYAN